MTFFRANIYYRLAQKQSPVYFIGVGKTHLLFSHYHYLVIGGAQGMMDFFPGLERKLHNILQLMLLAEISHLFFSHTFTDKDKQKP